MGIGLIAHPALAGDCMKFDAEAQAVEGNFSTQEFLDSAGRMETAYILTLDSPTCLDAEDDEFRVLEAQTVHVYSTQKNLRHRLRDHIGETILLWGRPFGAHTSHHHAPIVMDVSKINTD